MTSVYHYCTVLLRVPHIRSIWPAVTPHYTVGNWWCLPWTWPSPHANSDLVLAAVKSNSLMSRPRGVKSADRWWLWGGVVFSNNWIGIPLTPFRARRPTQMDCSQLTLRKIKGGEKKWVDIWPHFSPERECEKVGGRYLSSNRVYCHMSYTLFRFPTLWCCLAPKTNWAWCE